MSRYIDPPAWRRCRATITLRDKSKAQCGRAINRAYDQHGTLGGLCTQHAEILHRGKLVTRFKKTEGVQ